MAASRILIIRRDNIGDLVCTTPLIKALRQRFPEAWLGAMVNSYNAPVLHGNPDLDEVFVYTKAKHRGQGEDGAQWLPGILWRRLVMMHKLRRLRLDDVMIATTTPQPRLIKLAQWLKPKRIIGFGDCPGLDVSLPLDSTDRHEVEDVFRLASIYGIDHAPPACRVSTGVPATAPYVPPATFTIGIHISARKPSQRWPAERFAETMRMIAAQGPVRFVLLWSPGTEDNPRHPGDDARALDVLGKVAQGSAAPPPLPASALHARNSTSGAGAGALRAGDFAALAGDLCAGDSASRAGALHARDSASRAGALHARDSASRAGNSASRTAAWRAGDLAALAAVPGDGVTVIPRSTRSLPELIAALAECDALVCADGGAMHLGAGLGLPIVCLFGNSGAQRWYPWQVPYRLLQKPSLDVADIGVDEVVAAVNALRAGIPARANAGLP